MAIAPTPANGNPPATDKPPQIRVLAQYIKDLSFESPGAPKSLQSPGENPNLQVEVNVGAKPLDKDNFECQIDFKAKAKSATAVIYNLELTYCGVFQMSNFPQEAVHPVLFVNCPAILFPFVRRIIGDLTRDGGFPPLWLDPIDWGILYTKRLAELKAKGTAATPPVANT